MDSAFIYRAANELVQNAGTRNIKQIARSCSLDISETSRIKDMLGLLSLYFDKPLIRSPLNLAVFIMKSRFSLVDHMRLSSKEQKNLQKNKPYKGFSRFRTDLSLVGLTYTLYVLFLIMIMPHGHPFCYAAD